MKIQKIASLAALLISFGASGSEFNWSDSFYNPIHIDYVLSMQKQGEVGNLTPVIKSPVIQVLLLLR